MTELCPCGKALHYTDARVRANVEALVAEHGPNVSVRTPQGVWHVPRHYVALHGISAQRLPELAALHNWRRLPM